MTGQQALTSECYDYELTAANRTCFNREKTTAEILKDLYRAIQNGAGEKEVIACNEIGHLSAGIHSVYRIGNDASGRSFEWT